MVPTRRLVLAAPLLAMPALARAQTAAGAAWPSRPIRTILPFAPGGALDSAARTIGPGLGERLGQTILVENRTGAGGSVGAGEAARAAPDGHTLLWDALGHVVNPALLRGLPFDYATAFAPISLAVTFPQVIAVKEAFPARTLAEFIAAAKKAPGTITVGSQGNATAGHLAAVRLMRQAGIELIHVPYRGGADAARDLASGNLDAVSITALSAGPIVDGGRARFLAVAAPGRVGVRPDVPTMAEAGLPGLEISEWGALFAPAGTPPAIVARIHAALAETLATAEVKARLAQLAAEPQGPTPEAFGRVVAEQRVSMATLVREAGITAN